MKGGDGGISFMLLKQKSNDKKNYKINGTG